MKKFFKDILIGIKHGIKLPSLPKSVSTFHNHPLTRIFRVLGGLSILLVLSGSQVIKESIFFYPIFTLAFFQFIYIIIINLIKFFYIVYLWKNNKFQVRNSPLNRIASFSASLIGCIKGTCVLGLSGGTALGMGLGIDELLLNHGREPIFRNVLGKGLDQALNGIGIENPNKDITNMDNDLKTLKYRYGKLKNLSDDLKELDLISEQVGVKDSEFISEVKKDLLNRVEIEKLSIIKSKSKILSDLAGKDPFGTRK
jgi:hypothetical protein